jgi:hypothetical protein
MGGAPAPLCGIIPQILPLAAKSAAFCFSCWRRLGWPVFDTVLFGRFPPGGKAKNLWGLPNRCLSHRTATKVILWGSPEEGIGTNFCWPTVFHFFRRIK